MDFSTSAEYVARVLWADIKTQNLKAGDLLPLMPMVEKFMMESEFDPDEIAEGFELLVARGWLVERDDAPYITEAGFAALSQ